MGNVGQVLRQVSMLSKERLLSGTLLQVLTVEQCFCLFFLTLDTRFWYGQRMRWAFRFEVKGRSQRNLSTPSLWLMLCGLWSGSRFNRLFKLSSILIVFFYYSHKLPSKRKATNKYGNSKYCFLLFRRWTFVYINKSTLNGVILWVF